ncbi:phage tail tape measure protein [Rugamonas rivuli]|uniref:Phage tail tape measure protein n=1 Tax=Rugamonas rivuli TaxID=2743358 RepID=A0A843SB96_9BURK|nr:hypothetical protein [Rugamonas rivuli]MQA21765.1 hypothetical protein [Rugamonas rivuli]
MAKPYQMMLKLQLSNGASKGLREIAKALKLVEDGAGRAQKNLSALEEILAKLKGKDDEKDKKKKTGEAMAGVADKMFGALKSPYEAAAEAAQAQSDFETLNLGAQNNAAVYAKAAALSHKTLGTGIADNISRIRELNDALGDLPKSLALSEDFAKYSFAAKVANGGKDVEGQTANAAKALALRGTPVTGAEAVMRSELDLQSKVNFATSGKVNGAEFVAAAKAGKQAYQHFDKEYLYGQFSAYMAQESGETAGANAQGAYATLVGGGMDGKAKGFLSQLGLLQARGKGKGGKGGEAGLSAANTALMEHRPDKFIAEVLAPAIRKKYGKIDDVKMVSLLSKNFDEHTASFIGDQIVNQPRLQSQTQKFQQASNYGSAYQQYLKSPKGAELAAAQAWKNLLTVIGSVYLPKVTDALLFFAKAMDKLGNWLGRFPVLTQIAVGAFALLAGALKIGGTVLALGGNFSWLGKAAKQVWPVLRMIVGGIVAFGEAAAALLTPVGAVIAAIVALGAVIAGAWYWFHKDAPKPNAPAIPAGATATGAVAAPRSLPPVAPRMAINAVPPPAPAPVFKVENKLDYRGITTRVLQEAGARMAGPPTGPNNFDGTMNLASVAYAG